MARDPLHGTEAVRWEHERAVEGPSPRDADASLPGVTYSGYCPESSIAATTSASVGMRRPGGRDHLPMTRSRGLDRALRRVLAGHDVHVRTAGDWPELAGETA